MARKSAAKVDELIETLNDDRVTNAFLANLQEKIQKCINDQMERKLNDFMIQLKETMATAFKQVAVDTFNELIPELHTGIKANQERLNNLENQQLQKDLVIHGINILEEEIDKLNQPQKENMLIDLVCDQIKLDLNIVLERNDLNYAFIVKSKSGITTRSPIIISLTSMNKRKEILQSARNKSRRQDKSELPKNQIFYNERQTKDNAMISFKARFLVRRKKILSTWVFRGETYIKENVAANPMKITTLSELKKYE